MSHLTKTLLDVEETPVHAVAGRGLTPLSLIFFSRRERPRLEEKISSWLILSEYVVEETALGLALLAAR